MDEYLRFAKKLAKDAGQIMQDNFRVGIEYNNKVDNTPVTIADTAINNMVIEQVSLHYPTHGVLGEEQSSSYTAAEYVWVCDPIDGTIPYTLGVPTSMFSLALSRNGNPIIAVMYDPYLDRMFEAVISKGAKLNNKKIVINHTSSFTHNYVCLPGAQFGYLDMARLWQKLLDQDIRGLAYLSITYESSLLLSVDQILACIYPGKCAWDIAAIKLIVEEAGGKVTDILGNEQRYDQPIKGAVVSNGLVHDDILNLISEHIIYETNS